MSRRVVITGLGVISPLGNSPDVLWEALRSGQSGIAAIESLPVDHLATKFGGEARDFTGHIGDFGDLEKDLVRPIKRGSRLMCREIQMGVAAAQLALQSAGLKLGGYDPERTGVCFGSDYIATMPEEYADGIVQCVENGEFDFTKWGGEGLPKVPPLWLLKYLPNMPASHIAIYNDLRGPSNSITHREASANLSLGEAFATIVRGNADTIVAGATGTRIHPLRTVHMILQEQLAEGDDPAKLSRPFDSGRTGMVIGEGAGAVVLEELAQAKKRGATIYGEIFGAGSSTVRDQDGVADIRVAIKNTLRSTLRSAGWSANDVGHVSAHGLGTISSDQQESQGIADVFGAKQIPVAAAKGATGNMGAGSGVIELVASLRAISEGNLYPALNCDAPDSNCPVNVAVDAETPAGNRVLSLSVTPQGQASGIAAGAYQE
ncbi:MAG: 3-oxoacyl-[acyl-carrier-protein] synthase II [Pirellulaceae bacterium]|jgi:3-oxoacyl-[acyl-carrier-protein] synthase II